MYWIVGAGPMAVDYAKVLKKLNHPFTVIGRGEISAAKFKEETGIMPIPGGLQKFLDGNSELPDGAVVATGVESLFETTELLMKSGVKRILAEKPLALRLNEIDSLLSLSKANNSDLFIAYNRRFYASVDKCKEIIVEDGGVQSFHFEFTEWGHVIAPLKKAPGVKERWLLANSTHVIDLAFSLGGNPVDWKTYKSGALDWHPDASNFAGAGMSDKGALFTYQANWDAPGRWGVEILTSAHRLILCPMEKLKMQKKDSVFIEDVDLDDEADQICKPGLLKQVDAFASNNDNMLCSIDEHLQEFSRFPEDGRLFKGFINN